MTYRIPIAKPDLPPLDEYAAMLSGTWDTRQLSNFGPNVEALEELASDYLGVQCLAVSSGDVGLICAVAALGLPKGSRVLAPSFTFQSTINAVLWNEHVPVFADIDGESLLVDVRPEYGISAIVATDVFGVRADMTRIMAEDVPVVVDAAHSYGAGPIIRSANAHVFSLSGTKVVTSAEGGLVASRAPWIRDAVRLLRGYGFSGDYDAKLVGINGKMSELHAALGLLTLPRVESAVQARNVIAATYVVRLAGLPLRFQDVPAGCRSTYKDFAVVFDSEKDRAKAEIALDAVSIQTKRYFRPLHLQPAYAKFKTRELPVTEDVYRRILCLPIFGSMTTAEVEEVADVVRRACHG